MKTTIKYTEIFKQVMGIILIPLLYMGVFMFLLFSIEEGVLSELFMNILIFGGIFIVMAASVVTILNLIMVDGVASFDEEGVHIRLEKKSFLFPHDDFFIPYSNIESAGMNEDVSDRIFISLKTKAPGKSMLIFPDKTDNNAVFLEFWEGLERQFGNYNKPNADEPGMLIRNKGFYQSGFMKGLAYVSILLVVVLAAMKYARPDSVSTWKLVAFYCYAIPFVYTILKSNKSDS